MHSTQLLALAAVPAIVFAATTHVTVGLGSLVFDPNSIIASPGDLVNFHFATAPVSVAQSTFERPCAPSKDGIFSGIVMVPGAMVYQINVTDTDPVWLYDANALRCPSGMNMVINPPFSGPTIDDYISAAKSALPAVPTASHGGRFIDSDKVLDDPSSPAASTTSVTLPTSTLAPPVGAGGRAYANVPMCLAIGGLCVVLGLGLA